MSLGGSLTERSAVHVPDLDHKAGPETNYYAQLDSELACGLITLLVRICLFDREALYHECALDATCSLTGGSFENQGGSPILLHGKEAGCMATPWSCSRV